MPDYLAPMSDDRFAIDEKGIAPRPELIARLGVLTFINCGVFILVYAFGALAMAVAGSMSAEEYRALVEQSMAPWITDENREVVAWTTGLLHSNGLILMVILLLRTAFRLVGAVGMWRGRRSGFHIYAAAQLLGIFAPHVVLPWSMLGVVGPLTAVATTMLYGTQLRHLQ